MLAVKLPEDLERRLERLAERTGRSKSSYVQEAVVEHIDELEDAYLAEQRHQTEGTDRHTKPAGRASMSAALRPLHDQGRRQVTTTLHSAAAPRRRAYPAR